MQRFGFIVAALLLANVAAAQDTRATDSEYSKDIRRDYTSVEPRWWKGNTHTHSWWSDGDSPPEIAAAWYREHGYHFLVLSDHNVMQQGAFDRGGTLTFWHPLIRDGSEKALATYRMRFGDDWVVTRLKDGATEVRLKTLDEFRHLFEAPDEFIFVQGEEISAGFEGHPVHINGVNLQDAIMPRAGASVAEVIQSNLDAILEQGTASGREVIAHLNHPNFRYAVTVEDLVALRHEEGAGFFEVYNGHDLAEIYGDDARVGTEKMWDIVLAQRLGMYDRSVLFGVATDDAHNFALWEPEQRSNPGRGWVMVRSHRLTPDAIVGAMKRGDFYCSTGVTLRDVVRDNDTLSVAIAADEGVDYTIEFIGTRRNADLTGQSASIPSAPAEGLGRFSNRYSDDIGIVLETVHGTQASYRLRGDELYVRARVTSSAQHPNGHRVADRQMAWTQPLVAAK